jgi:hypothetical protein
VPSSGIIDLAIGLVFIFGVTAAISSAVTEAIARFLGLRGAYLLTGLRELVDNGSKAVDLGQADAAYQTMRRLADNAVGSPAAPAAADMPSMAAALLGGPILSTQGMTGQITSRKITIPQTATAAANGTVTPLAGAQATRLPQMKMTDGGRSSLWSDCRSLPAYISSRSFAEAVVDLVVPTSTAPTTMTVIREKVAALPDTVGPFKPALQVMLKNVGDDVTQFTTELENWYDDHMDRVSGWYKQHAAKITLVVGALLIVLLNINALTIGRTLYSDSAVSAAVSSVAASHPDCPTTEAEGACLTDLQTALSDAVTAGLPIGWGTVRACKNPKVHCDFLDQRGILSPTGGSGGQIALVLIGFLLMVISIVPGARFWFGLLSRLGTLRSSGPAPATTAS